MPFSRLNSLYRSFLKPKDCYFLILMGLAVEQLAAKKIKWLKFLGGVVVVQSLSHVRRFVTPTDCSMPVLPVLQCLPEFAQIHFHWVSNAIQPSHPLLPPSPFAFNLSQHQGLFQGVLGGDRDLRKSIFLGLRKIHKFISADSSIDCFSYSIQVKP